jgi:hypothetical protein
MEVDLIDVWHRHRRHLAELPYHFKIDLIILLVLKDFVVMNEKRERDTREISETRKKAINFRVLLVLSWTFA